MGTAESAVLFGFKTLRMIFLFLGHILTRGISSCLSILPSNKRDSEMYSFNGRNVKQYVLLESLACYFHDLERYSTYRGSDEIGGKNDDK